MAYTAYIIGAVGVLLGAVVWLAKLGNSRHRGRWILWLELIGIVSAALGYFLNLPLTEAQVQQIADKRAQQQIAPFRCELDSLKSVIREYGSRPEDLAKALSEMRSCQMEWIAQARNALDSGVVCIGTARYEEALIHLDYALRSSAGKDSLLADVHFYRGVVQNLLGRYEEAIQDYDAVLKTEPDQFETLYDKGYCLAKLSQFEDAILTFNAALKIDSNFVPALMNKGYSLSALGRNDDAIEVYNRALGIEPNQHEILYDKGYSLAALGSHHDAVSAYDAALKINPTYFKALYFRARSHAALQMKADLLDDLAHAVDIKSVYRTIARTDTAFKAYWSDSDFKKIVGE